MKLADIGKTFGNITPPSPIANFGGKDATGATGISAFLNNLISLIYIFAAITLLGMLLWGAFDWIISEGDKEKIKSAQNKIINAIIGIILFAVAFAVLRVLGTFTGFEFFYGQNFTVIQRDSQGKPTGVKCSNGKYVYFAKDFSAECQNP